MEITTWAWYQDVDAHEKILLLSLADSFATFEAPRRFERDEWQRVCDRTSLDPRDLERAGLGLLDKGYMRLVETLDEMDNIFCLVKEPNNVSLPAWRPTKHDPGWVYLLKCGEYYKIGRSKSPENRVRAIQTNTPFDVSLVLKCETQDASGMEGFLHTYFREQRGNGEWFRLTDPDVTYVREVMNA